MTLIVHRVDTVLPESIPAAEQKLELQPPAKANHPRYHVFSEFRLEVPLNCRALLDDGAQVSDTVLVDGR